jgi:predicted enzyme related to lactoylglutathione lyase
MIDKSMFVLAVPDLAASAAWYRDVMGFVVREIGDPGWRIFERDCCRIMAGHCPDALPPAELGDHAYFGYLVVSDAAALHAEVSRKGADVLKPLRDEPWGMREFLLRTVDGHRLMVGQNLG